VLYCNGPFCGKSKRLAEELLAAGHTNMRRYQLGIPVWRALGGVTEIEPEGLRYVLREDSTAVVIDARESDAFKTGTIADARNLPEAACSRERTSVRSSAQRTTVDCRWRTTTPG